MRLLYGGKTPLFTLSVYNLVVKVLNLLTTSDKDSVGATPSDCPV
jgi:hypothetical protein